MALKGPFIPYPLMTWRSLHSHCPQLTSGAQIGVSNGLCYSRDGQQSPPHLCQYCMSHIFSSLMEHPDILFHIYMDDIILGSPTLSGLCDLTANCLTILKDNFKVAPDKIQSIPPFKILSSSCPLISFPQPNPSYMFRIPISYFSSKRY